MTRFSLFAAAFALFVFAASSPVFSAKPADPACAFVQHIDDKALTSLTVKDISGETRAQRVRTLLRGNFDIPSIGRFVMGPAWRDATAPQKTQYMDLFEDMIVTTYARRFAEYSGQSFEIIGSTKISDKDTLVKSKIVQKDGPAVLVDWLVRNKGGMKVVDVVVEDISMSMTQRADFTSIIQSGGVDGLIKSLKDRVTAKKKK